MNQSFTRILDNQSNKLLSNLPLNEPFSGSKMDANVVSQVLPLQSVPLQIQSPQVVEGTQENKGIKLLGFEFTIYTLILVIVLIVCVSYFLYKYFFTKTDLVVYKKNPKKESKKKNKEEFSNESDASNMSNSSNTQTL
jgi:hypothetical protein